jgi:hypothetical protein
MDYKNLPWQYHTKNPLEIAGNHSLQTSLLIGVAHRKSHLRSAENWLCLADPAHPPEVPFQAVGSRVLRRPMEDRPPLIFSSPVRSGSTTIGPFSFSIVFSLSLSLALLISLLISLDLSVLG